MDDETHVSPDGLLRLVVRATPDATVVGFEGLAWHTHADILAAASGDTPQSAVKRFIEELTQGRLVIAVCRIGGRVTDAWILDDPSRGVPEAETGETIEVRLWDGTLLNG